MLNNTTRHIVVRRIIEIRKLISSSTSRVDDVDIASTACCICEVDGRATACNLLRHDESRCSSMVLLRVGALVLVMARLPTVVADGKATLLLRLLSWLLPLVLLLLLR